MDSTGFTGGEHMGVSENGGTPKSSILIGFSIINHPLWGAPIFGNTHIEKFRKLLCNRKLRWMFFFGGGRGRFITNRRWNRRRTQQIVGYCWWKKSRTSWYGEYPIIYRVLYIPGGAGFLPSTVCLSMVGWLAEAWLESAEIFRGSWHNRHNCKVIYVKNIWFIFSSKCGSKPFFVYLFLWSIHYVYIYIYIEISLSWGHPNFFSTGNPSKMNQIDVFRGV